MVTRRGWGIGVEELVDSTGNASLGGDDVGIKANFVTGGQPATVEVETEGIYFTGSFPLHEHGIVLKSGRKRGEMNGSRDRHRKAKE